MHLYGADPLQEARTDILIDEIMLSLIEIQTFFNENHGPDGRFDSGDGGSSSGPGYSPPTSGDVINPADVLSKWAPSTGNLGPGEKPNSSAVAALNEVHGHLGSALNIVGKLTQEGSLIARIQNGIREVQKGSAARKEASAAEKKEDLESVFKLPRWRDTNPSKGSVARVGEFLNKAASTIKQKWSREPEFRKDVYKELGLAISGVALHIVVGPAPELVNGAHTAVEVLIKSIDAIKKAG